MGIKFKKLKFVFLLKLKKKQQIDIQKYLKINN